MAFWHPSPWLDPLADEEAAAFDLAVVVVFAAAEEPLAPFGCLADPAAAVLTAAAAATSAIRSVSVHFLSERFSLALGMTRFHKCRIAKGP